ncbi:MAG: hypothetical protein U0414_32780 [Polyangiaceae bacterium]
MCALVSGCDDATDASTGSTSGATSTTHGSTSSAGGAGSTSATGGNTTTAASSGSSSSSGAGGAPTDPCAAVMPNCPQNVPMSAGLGLKSTDRCAFPIHDDDTWASNTALIADLALKNPIRTLGDILLTDLNRTATAVTSADLPGSVTEFRSGFEWEAGDESVAYWIPQGITQSGDGSSSGTVAGHKVVLVSWYYDKSQEPGSAIEKGVRLAIVDPTLATIKYRFVLLVEPKAGSPVDFSPIQIHAGGLAWFDHWLYVVDTQKGFRVFDLDKMLTVDTTKDFIGYDAATQKYYAANYKYVLPQVGAYTTTSACSQVFSFTSIDRSTTPPTLLSGEYCNAGGSCGALAGRLFRYKLGADGLLPTGTSWPSDAAFMGETQIQGATSYNKKYYLSSSAPAGGAGALYVLPTSGPSKTVGWIDSPEDVAFDPMQMRLWSLSEALGARFVFSVDPSGY